MGSPVEDIKARLDIVEFIQSYVRLDKAGTNYKAPCPFHSEKTPSFFVSPSRQIWHCFGGCGEGGDIFTFVMKIEGLDFPEALRLLAGRAGIELKREDPRIRSERNHLYDVAEAAAKLFERNLLMTDAAKEYVRSRGITEETARGFRIGWAPDQWDWLLRGLAAKGFGADAVEKVGLALRSSDGSGRLHDRFRSRVMFPIADANARVIGFGGRALPDADVARATPSKSLMGQGDSGTSAMPLNEAATSVAGRGSGTPKYINTPQTLIYDKSRALYGFDKAKQVIRAKNQVIVTEGYMDCVMSHQAGVTQTIAVSGTALTVPQLSILRRLCDTMICSFDADAAGDSATRRSLALAAQFDFSRRIAVIPSGKDPADAVAEDPALWRAAVEDARPVVAFYFDKVFRAENRDTAEGKKRISQALLLLVAELTDEIEKAHWIAQLSERLGVAEEATWKELRKQGAPAPPPAKPAEEKIAVPTRRDLVEERFLAVLALMPDEVRKRELAERQIEFSTALSGEIFRALMADGATAVAELAPHVESVRFRGEVLREIVPDMEKEFMVARRELELMCVRERLAVLGRKIAESGHDVGATLQQEYRATVECLRHLS